MGGRRQGEGLDWKHMEARDHLTAGAMVARSRSELRLVRLAPGLGFPKSEGSPRPDS